MSRNEKIMNLSKEIRELVRSYLTAGVSHQDVICVLAMEKQRTIIDFLKT